MPKTATRPKAKRQQKPASIDGPYLNIRAVEALTTLHRRTIHRYLAEGRFPEPIKVSPRKRLWRRSDVVRHIESL